MRYFRENKHVQSDSRDLLNIRVIAVAAFLLVPVFSTADPVHVQIQRGPNTLETHLDYLAAADFSRARYGYGSTAFSTTKPLRRRGIAQSSDFGNLVRIYRECVCRGLILALGDL